MPQAEAVRRGRVRLVLIGLFFALPFAIGWLAYALQWTPGATGNHGELVKPHPLAGRAFDALKGKWILVSFDRAACDKACEEKLYYMRQVRTAQGKERGRVARLWILVDEGAPRPELLRAIEGTQVVRLAEAGPEAQFPGYADRVSYVYLVDPLGNLMMRYPRNADPSGMIKDMARLLRYSSFG